MTNVAKTNQEKQSFAKRFKNFRENLGFTQDKMADVLGIKKDSVVNYENQRTVISYFVLVDGNKAFNKYVLENNLNIKQNSFADYMLNIYDFDDIYLKEDNIIVNNVFDFEKEKLYNAYNKLSDTDQTKIIERMEYIASTYENERNIPTKRVAILGQTACGNPIEAISIADEFIETNELKASFALRAVGDSMSPLINDGDTILIKQTSELEISDIGIFQINQSGFSDEEEVTCKMLKSIKDSIMTLVPLNAAHDPIIVDAKKHQVKIIGKYLGRA